MGQESRPIRTGIVFSFTEILVYNCGLQCICSSLTFSFSRARWLVKKIRANFKPISIGHFQVVPSLCFKARPSAKPLIGKWFFILVQINLLTRKVLLLASFWKWKFLELGDDLFRIVFRFERRLPVTEETIYMPWVKLSGYLFFRYFLVNLTWRFLVAALFYRSQFQNNNVHRSAASGWGDATETKPIGIWGTTTN